MGVPQLGVMWKVLHGLTEKVARASLGSGASKQSYP